MEVLRIFGDEAFEEGGDDVVVAGLRGKVWVEAGELVADATDECLLADAALHGRFAGAASGEQQDDTGGDQTEKTQRHGKGAARGRSDLLD